METKTLPRTLSEVDAFILRPNDDEPGIATYHADGTSCLNVFCDDSACDAYWSKMESTLHNEGFVCYHNIYFRAARLKTLEKCHTSELGHHLRFVFHGTLYFDLQYKDEPELDADLKKVTDILGILQDIRANERAPQEKQ